MGCGSSATAVITTTPPPQPQSTIGNKDVAGAQRISITSSDATTKLIPSHTTNKSTSSISSPSSRPPDGASPVAIVPVPASSPALIAPAPRTPSLSPTSHSQATPLQHPRENTINAPVATSTMEEDMERLKLSEKLAQRPPSQEELQQRQRELEKEKQLQSARASLQLAALSPSTSPPVSRPSKTNPLAPIIHRPSQSRDHLIPSKTPSPSSSNSTLGNHRQNGTEDILGSQPAPARPVLNPLPLNKHSPLPSLTKKPLGSSPNSATRSTRGHSASQSVSISHHTDKTTELNQILSITLQQLRHSSLSVEPKEYATTLYAHNFVDHILTHMTAR